MANRKTVFGFGSLIYTPSLLTTAPNADDIQPAYITGFKRQFSFWDAAGYTETNLDCAGEPMCALDIVQTIDPAARVNGVTFSVNEADFAELLRREEGYNLITIPAFNYSSDRLITKECFVFSAGKNDGSYIFDGKAQERYLEDFLKAARQYGQKYYEEAVQTTFIDDIPLHKVAKLKSIR